MKRRLISVRWISIVLAVLLVVQTLPARTLQSTIRILVQEGADVTNRELESSTWRVQVQAVDEQRRPIRGAVVVFEIQEGYGTFPDGSTKLKVITDDDGIAVAQGFRKGQLRGRFGITIKATYGVLEAVETIYQINSSVITSPPIRPRPPWMKWLIVGGGAAAAAVVVAMKPWDGNGETRRQQRTTISLGRGSVTPQP